MLWNDITIDNSRLKELGWSPKYTLEEALTETYGWYYGR